MKTLEKMPGDMQAQISISPRDFEAQIANLEQRLELDERRASPTSAMPASRLVSDPTVPDPFGVPPPPGTDTPPFTPETPDLANHRRRGA